MTLKNLDSNDIESANRLMLLTSMVMRVVGIRAQEVRRIVQSRDLLVQELSTAGSELARRGLPTVAQVGSDVVSFLDAQALLNTPDVPHAAELQTRSRHLDRSSQFLLCEIGGWRYCVSVRDIEATLPDTAVDHSVLFHGAGEGAVERHGLKMALMNPRVHSGFSRSADLPQKSGGIVVKLDAQRSLTLRADRITDILHLQRSQIKPIPNAICDRPDLFLGAVLNDDGLPCYVLDIARLVADPDVQALAALAFRRANVDASSITHGGGPKGVPGTAVFVRAAGLRAIPIHDLEEIVARPITTDNTRPRPDGFVGTIPYRETLLPVFCMSWLAGATDAAPGQRPAIIVVRDASERIGLLVQDIVGIERVQFVEDVPGSPGGPMARLAIRQNATANRLVAVWQLAPFPAGEDRLDSATSPKAEGTDVLKRA